ncbi:hypothetical protein BGM26_16975 [Bacillus sp. FJAT-29790]|uniref:hypothetical protein n=1 Tax=Bacillus sp. FJAT-29790 TaxID=1895002 RepID=UPI001C211D82|nr:hypothetical protein [Bacillus sp. FJAT-29790]MBU8880650.1 hypothetical protein [Bacillus sp. FJAT-29790]
MRPKIITMLYNPQSMNGDETAYNKALTDVMIGSGKEIDHVGSNREVHNNRIFQFSKIRYV